MDPSPDDSREPHGGFRRHVKAEDPLGPTRAALRSWLEGRDVDGVADLVLAASELLTNASAASSGPDSVVAVSVELADDEVELVVEDDGPGFMLPDELEMPPSEAGYGRGLPLVARLMATVRTELRDGRCAVVATRSRRHSG